MPLTKIDIAAMKHADTITFDVRCENVNAPDNTCAVICVKENPKTEKNPFGQNLRHVFFIGTNLSGMKNDNGYELAARHMMCLSNSRESYSTMRPIESVISLLKEGDELSAAFHTGWTNNMVKNAGMVVDTLAIKITHMKKDGTPSSKLMFNLDSNVFHFTDSSRFLRNAGERMISGWYYF